MGSALNSGVTTGGAGGSGVLWQPKPQATMLNDCGNWVNANFQFWKLSIYTHIAFYPKQNEAKTQ